jgi:hypothetical protein
MKITKTVTTKTSKITGNTIGKSVDMSAIVASIADAGTDGLSGAIFEEMTEIKNKSQEIVPVGASGNLRASADAVGVNLTQSGSRGAVVIGYGGLASSYSFIQHQTPPPDEAGEGQLAFRHAAGRTWKYLERPMLEAIDGMEQRLAARIRTILAAR